MSKTFKMCVIFSISTLWLVILRMVFSTLNLSDNVSSWLFSFLMQVVGMGVIPLTLYRFWVGEKVSVLLRVKTKLSPLVILLAILVGFLLAYATLGVSLIYQNIIRLLGFTHVNAPSTIYSSPEVFILELLCTAFLPAIFEEITDRGVAMEMLGEVKEDKTKILIIAILFSLAHQNILQSAHTFFGGFIMAYFAVKTNSLLPGMIIHFINNALSVIGDYSRQIHGLYAYYEDKLFYMINSNFFIVFITWVLAGVAIYFILIKVRDISQKDKVSKTIIPPQAENFYTYKNGVSNMQPLNDVFGFSTQQNQTKSRIKWYEYTFLYASIAMALATTIFTFIFGLLR